MVGLGPEFGLIDDGAGGGGEGDVGVGFDQPAGVGDVVGGDQGDAV